MLPSRIKHVTNDADVVIKIESGEAEVTTASESLVVHILDIDNEQLHIYEGDTLIEKRPI
jgi:hypothetical protein